MTRQQAIAYQNPCFEGGQCGDHRYYTYGIYKNKLWSIGLTANVGLE